MDDSPAPDPAAPAQTDSAHADRLYPSPNHGERRGVARPDSVILHYTGMSDAVSALLWLCSPVSEVSCHYFVFEDGRIWQLVPENRRAWHAGKSSWHGDADMNSRSVGIEIVNRGHDLSKTPPLAGDCPEYPEGQIEAVIRLVGDIATRWNIPAARILAHSDIAPGRKIDPGERFPWSKLAKAGIGLWVEPPDLAAGPAYRAGDEGMPVAALQSMFAAFGYGIEITGVYDQRTVDVVSAFQRHWRQARVDGIADSQTIACLRALMGAVA